jgi:4-hydroxy-tetrahydrodipicolinate synthase
MSLAIHDVKQRLRGVAVGLLTPFDDSSEIEYGKIEENAGSLYDSGVKTFLTSANISEYDSLSQSERVNVTERSVNALPSDACVLAGVGGSTGDAKDLIREYDRIGVDAMMIMPPHHTYIHERGLLDYYEGLASATDTPFVPYVRGFDPSVEYLAGLTRLDSVVGIKYALEDAVKLGMGIDAGDDDVVWVDGLAEPYALSYWAEGARGFSAGVSNFRPEVGLELYDALSNGNWDRARRLRNICMPYQNFRDRAGQDNTIPGAVSIPAVKRGLDLAGLYGGDNVRAPLRPLAPEEAELTAELYDQLDDDIDELVA